MERIRKDMAEPNYVLIKHRLLAVLWSLACMVFTGVILYQSMHGMQERFAADAAFTVIPLFFFAIGMSMRSSILKKRRYATALTTAVVVSIDRIVHSGKRNYIPEYKFQVSSKTYCVRESCGYSVCFVEKGEQVDLYYNPKDPNLFYVPLMQKHDNRLSIILCAVGILWPLLGLFAPQLRMLVTI